MAPSLAESWSASKDGLVYEFVLRQGARFHNGDPVTADDVKFSFERYRGAASKLLKDRVAAIEIPDPSRVRFRLKEPWPDFMTYYGSLATGAGWIVPRKYLEKVGDDGFKKAPVGAGPYRFVSFNPGSRAGAGGPRAVLAEGPEREAPRLQVGAGREPRAWPCSSAARPTSSTCSRASWPRTCGARRGSPCAPSPSCRPTGSSSSTSGTRSRRGRTGASAWPPTMRSTARPSTRRSPWDSRGSPGASFPRPSTSTGSRPPTPTIPPRPSSSWPRPATRRGSTPGTSGATPPPPP